MQFRRLSTKIPLTPTPAFARPGLDPRPLCVPRGGWCFCVLGACVFYPHLPEQHRELLEIWEAILKDEADPFHNCAYCGEPVIRRGSRGKRRLYCADRCRKAAARARTAEEPADWVPATSAGELAAGAHADGMGYLDAFPADHPPLNYPVVPRDGEANSQFGWAFEIIGAAA